MNSLIESIDRLLAAEDLVESDDDLMGWLHRVSQQRNDLGRAGHVWVISPSNLDELFTRGRSAGLAVKDLRSRREKVIGQVGGLKVERGNGGAIIVTGSI